MNGFIRCAAYSRVSSQRQADEMTIDSQITAIRQRAERSGDSIDALFEYKDDGYSGSELLRPALERLRDHVYGSMIERLYIHSPDRLARKFAHQAILLEEFYKNGCEVIFLNQEGLPDSPETNMLLQMQGMFAEYEREKILERSRRGTRHSASKGNVSVFSGAPYGYRYIRKTNRLAARWEVDPTESKHVQLMFTLVGEQGYSLQAVCRELQQRGIPTRRGKTTWDTSTIRGILRNPAYHGEARYGKTRLSPRKPGRRAKRGDPEVPRQVKVAKSVPRAEQIPITVPSIVSRALFEEAAKRMDSNRRRQRERQNGPMYLLSGLLVCGECGAAYCSRRQGSGKNLYYRCLGTDKHRNGHRRTCNNTSLNGTVLESKVWSDLCHYLRDPDRLRIELERRRQQPSLTEQQVAAQKSRINLLDERLNRLIDAYTQGLIKSSEFESRISPLRAQHDREVAELASLRGEMAASSDTRAASENLKRLGAAVEQNLEKASFDLKRELLTLLIKRIEIHHERVTIVYKVPQNPFVLSPANRGFLQHWLSRPAAASRLNTEGVKTDARP